MDRTDATGDRAAGGDGSAGSGPAGRDSAVDASAEGDHTTDASAEGDHTTDASAEGGEMTLAFDLAALESLADPPAVFADADRWAAHVGVVGDDAEAVESAVGRHGIRQDYEVGRLDAQSVLSRLKWEADTERYVLVGTDADDRALADYVGWEYLPVEEAAERAGWTLLDDLGRLDRLRRWLGGLVG